MMRREKRRLRLGDEITLGPEEADRMPGRYANIVQAPRTSTGRPCVYGALCAQTGDIRGRARIPIEIWALAYYRSR